ncbi:g915 [Coccomyxa viridis]|uniref:ceramide glucosyltransferase n=1 Tax=Coccomyxa viridis TaxID=1274662 RepID=A0ABP1FKS5_9CHLO
MHAVVLGCLQLQGAAILCLLGAGWLLSYAVRRKELSLRRRKGVRHCTQQADQTLPGVTVILPVKGCRKHSVSNWASHVRLRYAGPVEFLFVVDSQDDPAHSHLIKLAAELSSGGSAVRIVVAPAAKTCSQKIANLQAGIEGASAEHQWVLCVDDDVLLYEAFLEDLIRSMQQRPSFFMATGYPFDIPGRNASIATYCCLAYHLPLSIAFAVREHTTFVWGGCMLLPLAALRSDRYGILAAWNQGGYSDDLTVASKCAEHRLSILCPSYAVLPQWLDTSCSARQFWNYQRRQLYVMDTYCNAHNKRLNHTMLALHCYLSWAFILALLLTGLDLISALMRSVIDTEDAASPHVSMRVSMPAQVLLAAFAFAHLALWLLTGTVLQLFQGMPYQHQLPTGTGHFSWTKLWLAFCFANAVLPFCALYTWLQPKIQWSGITYRKGRGCITAVEHPGSKNKF